MRFSFLPPFRKQATQRSSFFTKPSLQRKSESGDLPVLQAKLTIGQPGDRYEQEADAMAERVVNTPKQTPGVQAKCATCENEGPVLTKLQRMEGEEEESMQPKLQRQEEEEEMQMKPEIQRQEEEEEMQMKPMIQREAGPEEEELMTKPIQRAGAGNVQASPELETQLSNSKGGGKALPRQTQEEMGSSFGADFSKVRVHTGSEAKVMSQSIQAQAFTHGKDVYFNQGKYQPESSEGKKLLAHELTHTIQQGAIS